MAQPSATVAFGDRNCGFQAGTINGPVHNEFHPPPERPETLPNPSCAVPFRRDQDFVDRGTLLDQIRKKCSAPASRIALVGLGGVGKSQLAIEHCYRTAAQSPETWVFWVHASNAARLEQGYRDIADQIILAGRNDPQADVFKLVSNWLRNENNGKWLLVLDNADDPDVLSPPLSSRNNASLHRLSTSLPPSKYGSVLVTSRTKHAASQLVEESDIISIEPMHNAGAQALLHKKLGDEVNKDGIIELAAALEFMPLALAQAAAYIRQQAPRCSVRQYLENFHKSDMEKTSLLNQEAGRLRRDYEAKNSVITTWQISFDHICQVRPSATDLLSLMSFFDRQGIPQFLLNKPRSLTLTLSKLIHKPSTVLGILRSSRRNKYDGKEDNTSAFEHDILTLKNYSFVTVNKDGATFEMHALVQLATRRWLKLHGHLEIWKQQYIKNLCTVFPSPNHENWTACRTLFPHVKSAEAHKPTAKRSLQKWVSMLYKAAMYADDIGKYDEAERMYISVIRVERVTLGAEHPDTLATMGSIALTYWNQGRWKEAEELEVQVMETEKRVLGAEHPGTLASMNNLAITYQKQGRWKEAEELEGQVIESSKRIFGLEDPDTLNAMNNLASTYQNQGRWKEAEELEVQVIETGKRVLGLEHPDTLAGINNLALTYQKQGRWKEAEELGVQVIESRKRVLGLEHPSTLQSMGNLASTYHKQGRWKEAEELGVQVIKTRKRVIGLEHPDTLTSMKDLASTYQKQRRWKEAEELGVQVIEARERVLGPEHPDTLTSINNLSLTLKRQCSNDNVIVLVETCF